MAHTIVASSLSNIADPLALVEDGMVNVGTEESTREIWKECVFPDLATFKKILGKFTMYNNFVLRQIKSNK